MCTCVWEREWCLGVFVSASGSYHYTWLAVSWSFPSPTLTQRCNMNVIYSRASILPQFKNCNSTALLWNCSLTAFCHAHTFTHTAVNGIDWQYCFITAFPWVPNVATLIHFVRTWTFWYVHTVSLSASFILLSSVMFPPSLITQEYIIAYSMLPDCLKRSPTGTLFLAIAPLHRLPKTRIALGLLCYSFLL